MILFLLSFRLYLTCLLFKLASISLHFDQKLSHPNSEICILQNSDSQSVHKIKGIMAISHIGLDEQEPEGADATIG